jgi:hypothetical protein
LIVGHVSKKLESFNVLMEQEGNQLPPVQARNLGQQMKQLFGHQPWGILLVSYLSWNCYL